MASKVAGNTTNGKIPGHSVPFERVDRLYDYTLSAFALAQAVGVRPDR